MPRAALAFGETPNEGDPMASRNHALVTLFFSAALILATSARAEVPPGTPVVPDAWSNQTLLHSTSSLLSPVHGTLLPDGRVLFMGLRKAFALNGAMGFSGVYSPPADLGFPGFTTFIAEDPVPHEVNADTFGEWFVDDTNFCAGNTLLADGRVIAAGGTRIAAHFPQPGLPHDFLAVLGLSRSLLYNPFSSSWAPGAEFTGVGADGTNRRWYPTPTRLWDGRIVVAGGFIAPLFRDGAGNPVADPVLNHSIEILNADGTTPTQLVSHDDPLAFAIFNADYTHTFQLPNAPDNARDVLMFGEYGVPLLFGPDAVPALGLPSTVTVRPGGVSSPMNGASSLLLPLRSADDWGYAKGSVLITGGGPNGAPTLTAADVFDPGSNTWRDPSVDILLERHHPSTTLLPDGRIAVIGGHVPSGPDPDVRRVAYIDPGEDFTVSFGVSAMPVTRGYHTVSVLLPDRRVLVAGGRTGGSKGPEDEQPTLQFLYPSYFAAAEKPEILSWPSIISYSESFPVTFSGTTPVEAVLIGLGSMTHSFDMNQRYVQLSLGPLNGNTVELGAPSDPRSAPPGYYMLFLLDASRIPSEAIILQLL